MTFYDLGVKAIGTRSLLRNILMAAGLLFVAWFGIFGGEIVLPMVDRALEKQHWRDYLLACKPDEVRVKQYLRGHERQAGTLNLTTGALIGEPAPSVMSYAPLWGRLNAVFHSLNFPDTGRPPYTENQIVEIKTILVTLPPPHPVSDADYHLEFHIAFYRGGQLCIYDYQKSEAKAVLAPLFQILGFSLLENQ
jgi:hypothetical protein